MKWASQDSSIPFISLVTSSVQVTLEKFPLWETQFLSFSLVTILSSTSKQWQSLDGNTQLTFVSAFSSTLSSKIIKGIGRRAKEKREFVKIMHEELVIHICYLYNGLYCIIVYAVYFLFSSDYWKLFFNFSEYVPYMAKNVWTPRHYTPAELVGHPIPKQLAFMPNQTKEHSQGQVLMLDEKIWLAINFICVQ